MKPRMQWALWITVICLGCSRVQAPSTEDTDDTDTFDPMEPLAPDTGIPSSRFKEISLGTSSTCVLYRDGQLDCWGSSRSIPPSGEFTHIARGTNPFCAIHVDGRTECWDISEEKPMPDETFVQLASGGQWACGLNEVGRVFCWGANMAVVNDVPDEIFVQIDAGADFACGLNPQGRITCWGNGGQTSPPQGAFRSIVVRRRSACALSTQGYASCWVQDFFDKTPNPPVVPLMQLVSPWCGLRLDGTAICWDRYNPNLDRFDPTQRFVYAAGSISHMCAVTEDDELICWGDDSHGQATPNDERFQQLASNRTNFCGLTVAGDFFCWGNTILKPSGTGPYQQVEMGDHFICGQRLDGSVEYPNRDGGDVDMFPAGLRLIQFDCAAENCCGVSEDGRVHCGPDMTIEQPPQSALKVTASPVCAILQDETISCYTDVSGWTTESVPEGRFKDLSTSGNRDATDGHRCGLGVDGEIRCWGENNLGQSNPADGAFVQLDVFHFHSPDCGELGICGQTSSTCAVGDDGFVQCWGANASWSYDEPDRFITFYPVSNVPTVEFTQVVVGLRSTCALRPDGRVACWGGMTRGLTRDDFE